jgi:DNA-binding transcriptional LysR family regulator
MFTLRLFCDVASQRSFSSAANRHGITQSAASQRIRHLEKQLGVTLFDRSVRPLSLTSAGEVLLRDGRELVQRFDQLTSRVSQMGGEKHGDLRGEVIVDAIYSVGIDLLNHLTEAFEKQTPHVTVKIKYKRPEQVHEAVAKHRCDFGIVSYPGRWHDVVVRSLRDERMSVVCSPSHQLAARQKVHAHELGDYLMANFESDLPAGRRIKRYLRDHGVEPRITNVFDNIDTIKHAIAVTNQIAFLPTRTVQREVKANTLVAIELTPELDRPIGIILPKPSRRKSGSKPSNSYDNVANDKPKHNSSGIAKSMQRAQSTSPACQAFIDFLLEHAGPDGNFDRKANLATSSTLDIEKNTSKAGTTASKSKPVSDQDSVNIAS